MATGYGVEVSLTDKLVTGRLVSGKQVVLEAWYRRLTTARGSLCRVRLPEDEDVAYGFDISELVGTVGAQRALLVAGGMAAAELAKDDRAYNVACGTSLETLNDGTLRLRIEISGKLVDTDEDLALTLSVTEVTTQIISAK